MAGAAALGLFRELRTRPVRNRPRTSRRGQGGNKTPPHPPAQSKTPPPTPSSQAPPPPPGDAVRGRPVHARRVGGGRGGAAGRGGLAWGGPGPRPRNSPQSKGGRGPASPPRRSARV